MISKLFQIPQLNLPYTLHLFCLYPRLSTVIHEHIPTSTNKHATSGPRIHLLATANPNLTSAHFSSQPDISLSPHIQLSLVNLTPPSSSNSVKSVSRHLSAPKKPITMRAITNPRFARVLTRFHHINFFACLYLPRSSLSFQNARPAMSEEMAVTIDVAMM
ncbi:hypothetical protein K469DRAFT_248535 [Zopfia rhizophila CBS 207.26]|uniref:Uncharacterized protein n=1 Tax=Zopfia rhizophila CBS 207.26 TaxID=1314779 RepID=A0A6A6DRP0_9PEZI|nr:hypothetical protein K469DRAFT_248535 [Zopfia rhizophila CBS 207.26]